MWTATGPVCCCSVTTTWCIPCWLPLSLAVGHMWHTACRKQGMCRKSDWMHKQRTSCRIRPKEYTSAALDMMPTCRTSGAMYQAAGEQVMQRSAQNPGSGGVHSNVGLLVHAVTLPMGSHQKTFTHPCRPPQNATDSSKPLPQRDICIAHL
jgi:hypothetical protein